MKKLCALVLALVMTLGLATVSTNAAFEGESFNFDDAVQVMAAVGVFKGDENGKFNPTNSLDRASAAKLIAYLALGEKTAEALPQAQVFSDVPANHWASKYIAYCANAGYVSGYDGKYFPAGELNGYAFGKMVLCVLGYDAEIEGLSGTTTWSINVAKLMENNSITSGIDTNSSEILTREQAAQYCFNALKANMVYYTGGNKIKIGDAEITQGATLVTANDNNLTGPYTMGARTLWEASDAADFSDATHPLQLGEKLYAYKLQPVTSLDDFGRDAAKWYYVADGTSARGAQTAANQISDNLVATAVSQNADNSIVLSKSYTANASVTTMQTALRTITGNKKLVVDETNTSNLDYYYNGDQLFTREDADTTANNAVYVNDFATDAKNHLGIGATVEYWLAEGSATEVEKVIITDYKAYKVGQNPNNNVSSTDAADGVKYYTSLAGKTKDSDIPGFNPDTYVKNAWVAVCAKAGGTILDSYAMTATTGSMSAYTGTGFTSTNITSITLDGTKYTTATTATAGTLGAANYTDAKYSVYLDKNGYALYIDLSEEGTAALEDVKYVKAFYVTSTSGTYGGTGYDLYAQAVDISTGTVERILIGTSGEDIADTDAAAVPSGKIYITKANVTASTNVTGKLLDAGDTTADGTPYWVINSTTVAGTGTRGFYTFSDVTDKDYKKATAFVTTSSYAIDLDQAKEEIKTSSTKLAGEYVNADTKFVLIENVLGDIEVKAYTGPVALKTTGQDTNSLNFIATKDSYNNKTALYVIVNTTDNSLSGSTKELYYAYDATYTQVSDGRTVPMYDMTGEEVNMLIAGDATVTEGTFYYISSTDSKGVNTLAAADELTQADYDASDFSYGFITGAYVNSRKDDTIGVSGNVGRANPTDESVAKAKIIDLRSDTDKDADVYTGEITNIDTLWTPIDTNSANKVWIDAYLTDDDGFTVIFVTDVTNTTARTTGTATFAKATDNAKTFTVTEASNTVTLDGTNKATVTIADLNVVLAGGATGVWTVADTTNGYLAASDTLVVTAEDGTTSTTYTIAIAS